MYDHTLFLWTINNNGSCSLQARIQGGGGVEPAYTPPMAEGGKKIAIVANYL